MEETSMNESRNRWIFGIAAMVMLVAFTVVAYNVGLSEGLARAAASVSAAAPSAPGAPYYGWHRPWGFGFGFLFPLLFFMVWIFLFRGFYWRPWGPWYYGRPRFRDDLDEWHRRAHERMNAKE